MKGSIGSAFLYNMIIVFLVIFFSILAGMLSYYKSFRSNVIIMNAIEKFEGHNSLAIAEIDQNLKTISYDSNLSYTCPSKSGGTLIYNKNGYCVYQFAEKNNYRSYGIVTYIKWDFPVINNLLRLPIYSKTVKLYNFG